MEDDCKGDGTCGRNACGCGDDHHGHGNKKVDLKGLGPEAVELAGMFEDINSHLVAALQARKKILEKLHTDSKEKELREKYEVVINACHPVLIQFVFGDNPR